MLCSQHLPDTLSVVHHWPHTLSIVHPIPLVLCPGDTPPPFSTFYTPHCSPYHPTPAPSPLPLHHSTLPPPPTLAHDARRQALRIAVSASTGVLFIPLTASLARVFVCRSGEMWLTSGVACFSDVHIVALVFSSVALMVFATACIIGTVVPWYRGMGHG